MSLQKKHFLLDYFETLSAGPAGVPTRDLPLSRPALSQLSWPGDGQLHWYTATSRKVVGKNVHATIPKGNMGYDQYTVPNTGRIHTRDGLFSKFITYYSRPVKHIKSILRRLLLPLALLHKSLVVLVFPLQFRPRLLPRNIIQHSFLSSNILQLMSQTGTFFSRIYRKTTMGEAKEWLKPKVNRLWTMNLIDRLGTKSKNRDLRYKRL